MEKPLARVLTRVAMRGNFEAKSSAKLASDASSYQLPSDPTKWIFGAK
jgi:hypothetical protein